jgi:hypothetical protein
MSGELLLPVLTAVAGALPARRLPTTGSDSSKSYNKFSKVRALVYFLHKVTTQRNFETPTTGSDLSSKVVPARRCTTASTFVGVKAQYYQQFSKVSALGYLHVNVEQTF